MVRSSIAANEHLRMRIRATVMKLRWDSSEDLGAPLDLDLLALAVSCDDKILEWVEKRLSKMANPKNPLEDDSRNVARAVPDIPDSILVPAVKRGVERL